MEIELKSNRRWIVYFCISSAVLVIIVMMIGLLFGVIESSDTIGIDISMAVIFLILICILISLLVIFMKGKSYKFSENEIHIFKKGVLQNTIQVENIEFMRYCRFRFYYLIAIIFLTAPEGGFMTIFLREKDGSKHVLGFIGFKDAKRLKKMYPELLKLY